MSVTRADFDLSKALIKSYAVKSGTTSVVGGQAIFTTTEGEVDNGAAGGAFVGTFLEAVVGDGTKMAQVALHSSLIVPMVVGTGGSTRGKYQVYGTSGVTDMAAAGVGTMVTCAGIAVQSGVSGDLIGVLALTGRATTT